LFRWINGWPDTYAPFYVFLSEANKNHWVQAILALFFIFLLWRGPTTRIAALLSVGSIAVANFICDLLKHGIPTDRPCGHLAGVINHGVGFLDSAGTASAHAANMAALAVVMTYFFGRWGLIPIFIAFFTGISRIYVGVHYPSQVLFGWACGLCVGGIAVQGFRWYEARKRVTVDAAKQ
jgi:undecaprenyl-diphosphatase